MEPHFDSADGPIKFLSEKLVLN